MLQVHYSKIIRCAAISSFYLTAACSSGGGGSGVPTTSASVPPGPSPAAPTSSATPCSGCVELVAIGYSSDTGIAAGPIAAPVPASFGAAPSQIAVSGGPTFDGTSSNYPANVTFPLISTSIKPALPGLSAVSSQDASLTVISSSASSQNLQLVIPSLNVNVNVNFGENIVYNIDGFTYGYSYVAAGEWDMRPVNPIGPVQSSTAFTAGYETPGSAMPSTGTANFSGLASGAVFKPGSGTILETSIAGKANLSANFSSGQVTGTLTQMFGWDGSNTSISSPWNDVSLNANIAPGTNRFSGTAAATAVPATGLSLAGSATGHVDGAFYGPAALNVGAVWSLSDGVKSAIGTLAATSK